MGQYANRSDEHKYHYYTWLLGEGIVIARYEYSVTNRLLLAALEEHENSDTTQKCIFPFCQLQLCQFPLCQEDTSQNATINS